MKLKFGNNDSVKWQIFGTIASTLLLIRLFLFDNIPFVVIKYNGIFYFLLLLIIIIAIIIDFLQAKETYLMSENSILLKIYKLIISFLMGGMIIAIYTNLIFISALDRLILQQNSIKKIGNLKIISKNIYHTHGNPHYSIETKNNDLNIETDFIINENKYNNYKVGDNIKFKYFETKNGTIYIEKGDKPIN